VIAFTASKGMIYSAYMLRAYCHALFSRALLAIMETLVFIMDDIVAMPYFRVFFFKDKHPV